jgi:hypothetical protein
VDRPFRGLAAAYAPAGDRQYGPNGSSIDDTLLRADPNPPAGGAPLPWQKRLFETNPAQGGAAEMWPDFVTGQATTNVYPNFELLTKIWNSVTTRSNCFAVWLTVCFFEVVSADGVSPPQLGQEIGRSENRHVRHRMFAIIDRTNMTIPLNGAAGQAGPRPFFINSLSAVTQAGAATISVPCSLASNSYEEMTWNIAANNFLLAEPGPNQEVVQVTGVANGGINGSILVTANFTKPHPAGFALSNAMLGNPGPQASFDPRNPQYSGVVRYFSIIE